MVPIVSIVGKSGSGKTTLLEKVIKELTRRGYTVGILKHDAHGFEIDHEGKDSWRHKKAGASTVALSSPEKFAVIKDVRTEWSPERIIYSYLSDADVVITEGYKTSWFPKLEVLRKAHSTKPVCAGSTELIGFVTDVNLKTKLPMFGLNDYKAVSSFIVREIINKESHESVSLIVDGAPVPLKPFIDDLIREGVTGMIKSLKGCGNPGEIEIRIKPKRKG